MKIGELSRRSGVSVRMLRYYESQGLLNPLRSGAAYRIYREEDLATVERIRALNAAGLTLGVIRRILPCVHLEGPRFEPCDEFKNSLRRSLSELEEQIRLLNARRAVLSGLLAGEAGGLSRG